MSGRKRERHSTKYAVGANLLGLVSVILGCGYFVFSSCAYITFDPSVSVTEQEVVGSWCGPEGERFTFLPDGSFALVGLGQAYRDDLLEGDPGYVYGYRVMTEFNGVPPTSGNGTWDLGVDGRKAYLAYDALDQKSFTDGRSTLDSEMEDDEFRLILYLGDRDPRITESFSRCMDQQVGGPSPTEHAS